MNSQLSTFMALSGFAAATIYLTDNRPAWIWADDGKTVLWANPAGAAFFGVNSLGELSDLSGLARAPARPHIARVATTGPTDRDTTDRLRFYRGLRVMLLTCACRRLVLPDGRNGALIVATDAPDRAGAPASPADLVTLLAAQGTAVVVYRRNGEIAALTPAIATTPSFEAVKDALHAAKHAPAHARLEVDGEAHDARLLMLETGEILLAIDTAPDDAGVSDPAETEVSAASAILEAPATSVAEAHEPGAETLVADTDDRAEVSDEDVSGEDASGEEDTPSVSVTAPAAAPATAPATEPAPVRHGWRAAGSLFAFASATRFLSPGSPATPAAKPADDTGIEDARIEDAGDYVVDERPQPDNAASDFAEPDMASVFVEHSLEETFGEAEDAPIEDDGERDDTSAPLLPTHEHAAEWTDTEAEAVEPATAVLAEADASLRETEDAGGEVPDGDASSASEAVPVVSGASPEPEASADIAGSGFLFERRERAARFAWKMDIDRRFTFLSPEFEEALGPEAGDIVGLTWEEVAERFALDDDGRVAAALRRRDTWSGRTVLWPVSGQALRVPVDMAALPAFDRNRVFEGFRGFGVCRTAEAEADPEGLGTTLLPREAAQISPEPAKTGETAEEPASEAAAAPREAERDTDTGEAAGTLAAVAATGVVIASALTPSEAQAFEIEADTEPRAEDISSTDEIDGDVAEEALSGDVKTADAEASGTLLEEAGDTEAAILKTVFAENAPDTESRPENDLFAQAHEAAREDDAANANDAAPVTDVDEGASGQLAETVTPEHLLSGEEILRVVADETDDRTGLAPAPASEGPKDAAAERPEGVSRHEDTALEGSRLSRPEREAFRKIAEALGAHTADEPARISAPGPAIADLPPVASEPHDDTASTDGPVADASETDPLLTNDNGHEDEVLPSASDPNVISPLPEAPARPRISAVPTAPVPPVETTGRAETPRAPRTTLLDKLPVGVAIVHGEDVDYANATLLDLLGYPNMTALKEAGGLDALFAEPEDWPSSLPGAMTERTMRIRLAEGGGKPVKARLHTVPWRDGTALMMSLLDRHDPVQEATLDRLHEAQTALSLAEEQAAEMDAVLETATDGVLILDENGLIVKVNRSAEALFNATREEMVGAPLTDYLAQESHRDAVDYLDGLARNGVASVLNDGREVIGQLGSGGLIPLFMTIGRVGHGEGGARFCTVLRDITQWKKAEEELTDAKRQAENASSKKSDFLAKISHEIRTPLNAIIGFSEVMMEERFGPVGNDRYKGYLRDIHNSGSHIMSLINDLLDLSKIEAGKLDLTFEAVSANDIIRECVALMQPQANRERVIIRASLPTSVPNIVADGRSVRQIVLNLLSNAIKFNQPGGQVIVSSALEDSGEVILRVRDTGMGMSHQDLSAAMEPFRQLHTARHGGGTGLGLPLTKALVEANRASFRIDSELNHGTLIEITFPPQRVLAE